MTELQYSTGAFRGSRERSAHSPQQRLFGIAFAVAMEAGIVYALLVTLEYVEAPKLPSVLQIVNVAPIPKDNDPPPPPLPTFEPPPAVVIEPVVTLIYDPPPPITSISVPPPPVPVPATPPRVVPPLTPPVAFTQAKAIASTHTTPEYPPISRRLREQGTLRLKIAIDEKGVVTGAAVVNSSGFQRLDEAAMNWVKAHWRYTPAMQGTKAVPSMADAIVEFRLQ